MKWDRSALISARRQGWTVMVDDRKHTFIGKVDDDPDSDGSWPRWEDDVAAVSFVEEQARLGSPLAISALRYVERESNPMLFECEFCEANVECADGFGHECEED